MDLNKINISSFAYIGDSVYELCVRKNLISKNILKPNEYCKMSKNYVSAVSQEKILNELLIRQKLTDEEIYIIKRARNYTPKSKPKNVKITTYKKATALEALFGYLYLNNDINRIKQIFNEIKGD